MILDINKNYRIESDLLEFTVKKKAIIKGKDGKPDEITYIPVTCGHCGTLQQACKTLLSNTLKGSKAINNLQQVVKELEEMKTDIDKALAPLDIDKIVKKYEKYNKIKPEMVSDKDSDIEEDE